MTLPRRGYNIVAEDVSLKDRKQLLYSRTIHAGHD